MYLTCLLLFPLNKFKIIKITKPAATSARKYMKYCKIYGITGFFPGNVVKKYIYFLFEEFLYIEYAYDLSRIWPRLTSATCEDSKLFPA